ncbi:MAG: hypothetical protein LAT82_01185 [Nanoarchaeota archaeon]|nr:hypothetical protein [Nanoarchaeota archaeon]
MGLIESFEGCCELFPNGGFELNYKEIEKLSDEDLIIFYNKLMNFVFVVFEKNNKSIICKISGQKIEASNDLSKFYGDFIHRNFFEQRLMQELNFDDIEVEDFYKRLSMLFIKYL